MHLALSPLAREPFSEPGTGPGQARLTPRRRSGAAGTRPMAGPERGWETQRLSLPWASGLQAVRSLPAGPCPVVSGPPWPSLSSPPPSHAGPYPGTTVLPARARVDVAAPGSCRLPRKGQEVCRSPGSLHRVWPSGAPGPALQGLLPGGGSAGPHSPPGPRWRPLHLPAPHPLCSAPWLLSCWRRPSAARFPGAAGLDRRACTRLPSLSRCCFCAFLVPSSKLTAGFWLLGWAPAGTDQPPSPVLSIWKLRARARL